MLERQIQLVCLFTFVRDDVVRQGQDARAPVNQFSAFGSYLVRVRADGSRMAVDMARHATQHASSSLFYDVSFNAVYVSTYKTASFSGPKHVLKARLSAAYNFRWVVSVCMCGADSL